MYKFTWDEESGISKCEITFDNRKFYGTALCHHIDEDMKSEITGSTIAQHRALLEMLKYVRDKTLYELKGVKQLYYTISSSTHCNPDSYEFKMIKKSMDRLESDLKGVRDAINEQRDYIYNYINAKDEFYQQVRTRRKDNSK